MTNALRHRRIACLALPLAVAGCGATPDAEERAPVGVSTAGIPAAAPGATGVSFDSTATAPPVRRPVATPPFHVPPSPFGKPQPFPLDDDAPDGGARDAGKSGVVL